MATIQVLLAGVRVAGIFALVLICTPNRARPGDAGIARLPEALPEIAVFPPEPVLAEPVPSASGLPEDPLTQATVDRIIPFAATASDPRWSGCWMPEVTIQRNHALLQFRCPDQTMQVSELTFASALGARFYTLQSVGSIEGANEALIEGRLRGLLATLFPDRHELGANGAALLRTDRRLNDEWHRLAARVHAVEWSVSTGIRLAFARGEGSARQAWVSGAESFGACLARISGETRSVLEALAADFGARALAAVVLSVLWLLLTGTFGYGWLRARLPRGALLPATSPSILERWAVPVALGAVAVSFLCFSLAATSDPPTNGADGAAIGHLIRDCLELGHCATSGPKSSSLVFHGTQWVFLSMLVRLLGGGSRSDELLVHVLLSVGLGTLLLTLWRWLRPEVAVASTALALVALLTDHNTSRAYAPSSAFCLDALCFCAMLLFASTGALQALMLAAALLAVAINLHVGSFIWVPALLMLSVLGGRRAFVAPVVCLGTLLGISAITSLGATLVNISLIMDPLTLALLAGIAVVLVLASAAARPFFLRANLTARTAVMSGAVTLGFSAARLLLQPFLGLTAANVRSGFDHCAYAMIVPASVLTAMVGARLAELAMRNVRWPRLQRFATSGLLCACFSAGCAQMTWHRLGWSVWSTDLPAAEAGWTKEDAKLIEPVLARRGLSFRETPLHLENAACWNLVPALGIYADPPTPPPTSPDPFRQVRLWLVREDELPTRRLHEMDVIPLPHHRAAIVSEIQSWLDPDRMRHCLADDSKPSDESCWSAEILPHEKPEPGFLFTDRDLFWENHRSERLFNRETVVIPLRATAEERTITLYQQGLPQECTWSVAAVQGLQSERILQSQAVRVTGSAGATGRLVLQMQVKNGCTPPSSLPCLVESVPGDPVALASADLSR